MHHIVFFSRSRRLIYSFNPLAAPPPRLPDCSNSNLFCKSLASLTCSSGTAAVRIHSACETRDHRAHEFCCEKILTVVYNTMATSAQQSQQSSSAAPKTRLGLSLSERIKVIEARQMGKSMRQVYT